MNTQSSNVFVSENKGRKSNIDGCRGAKEGPETDKVAKEKNEEINGTGATTITGQVIPKYRPIKL